MEKGTYSLTGLPIRFAVLPDNFSNFVPNYQEILANS